MDISQGNFTKELYFLVAKFLSSGPCKRSAEALIEELAEHELLARRIDWEGNSHPQTFQETAHQNRHIPGDFLLQISSRIGPLLEKYIPPNVRGVPSLLGSGRQSLLRTGSETTKPTINSLSVCHHDAPLLPPMGRRLCPNLAQSVLSREISGPSIKRNLAQPNLYAKQAMHRRILGHLSAVYCVLFDRTGQCIITGADDSLVKIWSTKDGRLLATLRGHNAEISDIAINYENTLVAAGSCDKLIRVWSVKTTYPIAVLQGHTGMITSLQFCPCPLNDSRYLMSTGGDGTVCFWKWHSPTLAFDPKPVRFIEKSRPGTQMVCSSFSPGGSFLVAGSTDHIIRIYQMQPGPPERIAELDVHMDHVDSIQFNHSGDRFLSGSRDGTARIWFFKRSKWENILLDITRTLPGTLPIDDALKAIKPRVTMVAWDLWDHFVVTAINDHTLKVWHSTSGALVHVLQGHHDEMFVLEAHPIDPHVFLSAGHDGLVILWNLNTGQMIKSFFNSIEGQGHGAVFDCKFSPDGLQFACTDSHGHLCIFGYGSSDPFSKVPSEQFFHTDYRPLIRDANSYVLDEQTQTAPHLMPPPFLVDVDGNPHPQHFQRLVPGHGSNIRTTRRPPPSTPRDEMPSLLAEIEAAEHGNQQGPDPNSPARGGANIVPPLQSPGGSRNYGMRQSGDVEGVRQAHGNVPVIEDVAESDVTAWRKRTIAPDIKPSVAKFDEEQRLNLCRQEMMAYLREKKKRPQPAAAARAIQEAVALNERGQRNQRRESSRQATRARERRERVRARARVQRATYATRATVAVDEESGEDDVMMTPSESEDEEEEEWTESSSESSEYSDWTEEVGIRAQPSNENRRTARRVRRVFSTSDEETEAPRPGPSSPQRSSKQKEKRPKKPAKKKKLPKKPKLDDVEDMLTHYQPSDWIMCTKPRLSPFLPQIGDEVYYFRQGHERYVTEVIKHKLYDINPKKQCYYKLRLKAEELCRIVSLHFSLSAQGPPTLACLKLAIINPETGSGTGGQFTLKYHDMPDVLDFIILRQHYDRSIARNWQQGDRFRSVIDDSWWAGEITERSPVDVEYVNSQFVCLTVQWDTGETERMSPWDLERVSDQEFIDNTGAATSDIPLTDEDRQAFSYMPTELDWFGEGREETTTRILSCMEALCQLSLAGPFVYPVDVQAYPDYWSVVPYPVDLSTITDKLQNRCYRRANALIWDIKQLERNARLYNEEESQIVKNSTRLVNVISEFIRDSSCPDILALVGDEEEEGGEIEVTQMSEESGADETTDQTSDNRGKRKKSSDRSRRQAKRQRKQEEVEEEEPTEEAWMTSARTLLNFLMSREDAEPFLAPVNLDDFPDYTDYVQEPMDFSTVASKLDEEMYSDPDAFVRDIRLVFSNSRGYNTLPRSRIYSMTIRLSAMFEDRVDSIFSEWYACASGGARRTRLRTQQLLQSQGAPGTSSDVPQSSWRIVDPQEEAGRSRAFSAGSTEDTAGYAVIQHPSRDGPLRTTIRLPHSRQGARSPEEAPSSASSARVPPLRISVRTIAEVPPSEVVSPPEGGSSSRSARPSRTEAAASGSISSSSRRRQPARAEVVVNGDALTHQYSTRRRSRLVSEESQGTIEEEMEEEEEVEEEEEEEGEENGEAEEENGEEEEENGEEEEENEEEEDEEGEEEESEESDESEDSSSEAQPTRRSTVRPKVRPTALPRKPAARSSEARSSRSSRKQSSSSARDRSKRRSSSTSVDLDSRPSNRRNCTRLPAMSYAESESDSDNEVISVSSRGRVRRPTQRMLDYLE